MFLFCDVDDDDDDDGGGDGDDDDELSEFHFIRSLVCRYGPMSMHSNLSFQNIAMEWKGDGKEAYTIVEWKL